MASFIQKDSWWMVVNKNNQDIVVCICEKCHKEKESGWYWPGIEKGYGNYDCKCHFCNEIINQRKEEYEEHQATI